MRIGLSHEAPVPVGTEIQRPLLRVHDFRDLIAATGFDQEDAHSLIFSKPSGDHGSGGPCSADNEVVMAVRVARVGVAAQVSCWRIGHQAPISHEECCPSIKYIKLINYITFI